MGIPQQITDKIVTISEAKRQIELWKKQGDKIVFTNGVFDLMHPGHVSYLIDALHYGQKLVIGLNSDDSVKQLGKGPDRPINDEKSRAVMLAALASTSLVVVFNEPTPLDLILNLEPDVLIKGGDYTAEAAKGDKKYVVGSEEIKNWGGEVICIPFLPFHSSTKIINKIRGIDGES